jgi:hypothetical protein
MRGERLTLRPCISGHRKPNVKQALQHSPEARAELPQFALSAATLLNIRVIIDHRTEVPGPFTIAFVKHAKDRFVLAYVHCEIKPEWVPDEAAWIELFSQLWPGY